DLERVVAPGGTAAEVQSDRLAGGDAVCPGGAFADQELARLGRAGAGDPQVRAGTVAVGELRHERGTLGGQQRVGVHRAGRVREPVGDGGLGGERLVDR